MRARSVVAIVCLIVGCQRASLSSTASASVSDERVAPGVSPGPAQAVTEPKAAEGQALPPLPSDLEPAFGELYARVQVMHAAPKPRLDQPLVTVTEHQVWLDTTLEPWRDSLDPIQAELGAAFPQPSPDARGEALTAWARAHVVHSALKGTVDLDEAIVRAQIPWPREMVEDPSRREEVAKFTALVLGHELRMSRLFCLDVVDTVLPLPPDLEPWGRHCEALLAELDRASCKRAEAVGIDASDYCPSSE